MTARRLRTRLKGWGGVGAMAVACVMALVLALTLPLGDAHGNGSTGIGGQGVARGTQARAAQCTDPQDRSPAPSGADGATIEAIKNRKDRRLIVGVDQNSYHWGYRDPNNPKAAATWRASTSTWSTRSPRTSWATRTPSSSGPSRPASASPRSSAARSTWWCAP